MERDFKGIWIPAEIWENKKLSLIEKLFFVEIDSLDGVNGCYASNDYFSKFFELSKNRCTEIIKSLEKKRLITIELQREPGKKNISKRIIRVLGKSNRGYSENRTEGVRKTDEGCSENREENNTLDNNTRDNNINISLSENMEKVFNAWNELAEEYNLSKIKDFTKTRQSSVKARLKENSIESILEIMQSIKLSNFLLGNKTDFKITFDFFIKAANFQKVKEGNYIDKKEAKNAGSKDTGGNGNFDYSGFKV